MSARKERWVMVRLLRETRAKLKEWLNIQDTNFCRGKGTPLRGQEDGVVSLDAAIAELLRRDEAHRARAKKGRKPKEVKNDFHEPADEVPHMGLVEWCELNGLV